MKTQMTMATLILTLVFNSFLFGQKEMKTFYDAASRTKIKEKYFENANNQKHGLYIHYDNRGLKDVEIQYTNGRPNGIAKEYYLPLMGFPGDEKLKKTITYVNGVKEGLTVAYMYIKDNKEDLKEGVKTKAMEQYFKKDELEREVQYFLNGKIAIDAFKTTGTHKEFYNTGKNKLLANLKDGNYEGAWQEWYENGQIAVDGTKKNHRWFGTKNEFFYNGKQKSIENFSQGDYNGVIYVGEQKYFDTLGVAVWEDFFGGKISFGGNMRKYYLDSKKVITDGGKEEFKRIGPWTLYYDKDFNPLFTKQGAEFFRKLEFDEQGKVNPSKIATDSWMTGEKQWEGFLADIYPDVLIGKNLFYTKSGKIELEMIVTIIDYKTHERNNINYYENGQVKSKGKDYDILGNGNWRTIKRGEWKFFDESGKEIKTETYDDNGVLKK